MNTTVDLAQGAELHVDGTTVGVFLPETKLRELTNERDSLRRELDVVRSELATLRAERDRYARSLTSVTTEVVPIDEATCEARVVKAENDGLDFREVVRQVEEIVRSKERDHGK